MFALASFALIISSDTGLAKKKKNQDGILVTVDKHNPWTSLEINDDHGNVQFALVADRTGWMRPGVFKDAITKLNLLQPKFVISLGDVIMGYTQDEKKLNAQWEKFNSIVNELTMPFFYIPGNRDYSNKVMAQKWKNLFGRTYYHFVYRDVLFLCLNTEEAFDSHEGGAIPQEQFDYAQKVLEENKNVHWTLVFMHKPLWIMENTGYWKKLETLLHKRKHTVFAAHDHHYMKYVRQNSSYIILATTGGGSRLRGQVFGEFDHMAWVTMTDKGPIVANLMLDGIWDEDIRDETLAEKVKQFLKGNQIAIDTFYVRDEHIGKQTTLQAKLSNTSDFPMKLNSVFISNKHLIPEMAELNTSLTPHSVQQLKLPITVRVPSGASDISPLVLRGTCLYSVSGFPPVEIEFERKIGINLLGGRFILEAESMNLKDYKVEVGKNLDGVITKTIIKVNPEKKTPFTGTAATVFSALSGKYDIILSVVPEHDGTPTVTLFVNSREVFKEVFPTNSKWYRAGVDEFEYHVKDIPMKKGDEFRIEGTSHAGAYARIDKVTFIPRK